MILNFLFVIFFCQDGVASSTSQPVSTMSPTTVKAVENCYNETIVNQCVSEFNSTYPENRLAFNNINKTAVSKCDPTLRQCLTIVDTSNCSTVNSVANSNRENVVYAPVCTAAGLKVGYYERNCLNASSEETLKVFCSYLNESKCSKNEVLKPFVKKCAPKPGPPSTKTLPLLPNPIGPEGITAVVVIVCLLITVILATFFFWPKCHNPKAGVIPKKSAKASGGGGNNNNNVNNNVTFQGSSNPGFVSDA